MGIRIHRALGWAGHHPDTNGLLDRLFEDPTKGEVLDLMIRATSTDPADALHLGLEAKNNLRMSRAYPDFLKQIVVYADCLERQDGLWVIAPPQTRGSWHRVDDDMDYQMERWSGPDWASTKVSWLPHPPSPYEAISWIDPISGQRVHHRNDEWRADGIMPVQAPPASVQVISEWLGFPDWKGLKPAVVTWWS